MSSDSKVPGKVALGSGVFGSNKEGYTRDAETGAIVLPTTVTGPHSFQRGAQKQFTVVEVSEKGVILTETEKEFTLTRDSHGNRNVNEVKLVEDTPEMVRVEPAYVPPAQQEDVISPPFYQKPMNKAEIIDISGKLCPKPPNVKVTLSNASLKLTLKWHACIVEKSGTKGFTVVLVYDRAYDPDFDIDLPLGVEYDLTISTNNGVITTCKNAFYGGQSFKFKDWSFFVLFSEDILTHE